MRDRFQYFLYKLKKLLMFKKKRKNYEYNETDYEFMGSLSAAILARAPSRVNKILMFWFGTVIVFILWASFASIDEVVRGDGKVIPYSENQLVSNLEGGIVDAILVNPGDRVTAGQVIMKISNSETRSSYESNEYKIYELRAKRARLYAEATGKPFRYIRTKDSEFKKIQDMEKSLYDSNKNEERAKSDVLLSQIEQRKEEMAETKQRIIHLKKSLSLSKEEVAMIEPMVKEGIKSRVEFLQLKRALNDVEQQLSSAQSELPKQRAAIREYQQKKIESSLMFSNEAKEKLNEASAELDRIQASKKSLHDQVDRSVVRSPVDGVVQDLLVNTIGGVVKPGQELIEIVPTDDVLVLEVKIKPSDIAFIHPGAIAMVKFTAYDYSIHGGLEGKVFEISPNTIKDEDGNVFYEIKIKTNKNYLGSAEHPLHIIPGMVVSVDIVTGDKTIMEYILKPILKSKTYVFSER
ncbi:MAG: HlyD family type I secretion periplasmic adaptor subunit [Campylobacterota bacterium]|nr:HlyD family type I secretion periplasmic adaptor subunit [Campylobacterota bacterium]